MINAAKDTSNFSPEKGIQSDYSLHLSNKKAKNDNDSQNDYENWDTVKCETVCYFCRCGDIIF